MQIKRVKYKEVERFPEFNLNKSFKEDFFGSSPAPFIGRFGYPYVNVGVLSPQFSENTGIYDAPREWSASNFSINKIANMRYGLVNSQQKARVHDLLNQKSKILEVCQEVGMASKPVELEINLTDKPKLHLEKESEIIPFGPAGKVRKIRITENTKVNSKVDKIVSDIDLKAVSGVWDLYQKGFDENFLSKLISVGNLGIKKNRKLVPTRWSITSIDDTVGKKIGEEVKRLQVGEFQVYFGGGWGNYYLVLFFPEVWSFELFETYLEYKVNPWSKTGTFYSTDYENFNGRKSYAQECAGGYYASRLPVLEKMKELKRQHSALVLRFITPEYNMPLGVWVCREATRKSLNEKSITFGSKSLMLKYCEELVKKKFGFDIQSLLKESKLLTEMEKQKKLVEFN
ncbi:hypothetical protein GOV03_01865 [Candidatus Woesearchaeota archaeon]|nr:hypothetical protein [Candidatus Woesearchaeota archaeon]